MKSIFDFLKENETLGRLYEEYGPQIKRAAVVCLIGFVLFAGFSLIRSGNDDLATDSESVRSSQEAAVASASEESGSTAELSDGTIFVDIGGAVKNPMLAELPDGSRVEDAIKAAGGLNKEADMSSINRAEFLVDGQKIYIPSLMLDEDGNVIESADRSQTGVSASGSGLEPSGKVNINTADAEQLQTLNGVGPATARKILDYREANGSFKTAEDLKNVSGIGDKTYEKLKDHITV